MHLLQNEVQWVDITSYSHLGQFPYFRAENVVHQFYYRVLFSIHVFWILALYFEVSQPDCLPSFFPPWLASMLSAFPTFVCVHLPSAFNYFAFLPYSPGGQSRNQPFLFLHIFSHVSLLWRFFKVASTALSIFLPRGDPPHVGIVSFFHPCPAFGEECLLESEEGRNLRPPQPSRPSDQTYIAVQSMRW